MDDNFLKVVGYCLLSLYTMSLVNFPMLTLGISFILFIIVCAIAFLYDHIKKRNYILETHTLCLHFLL